MAPSTDEANPSSQEYDLEVFFLFAVDLDL
jgi:hypothetical protein